MPNTLGGSYKQYLVVAHVGSPDNLIVLRELVNVSYLDCAQHPHLVYWQGLFYDFNRIKGSPAIINASTCNLTNCSWQGLFLNFNSSRYSPATLNVPTSSDKSADMGINPCEDYGRDLLTDTPSPHTYVERSFHELQKVFISRTRIHGSSFSFLLICLTSQYNVWQDRGIRIDRSSRV